MTLAPLVKTLDQARTEELPAKQVHLPTDDALLPQALDGGKAGPETRADNFKNPRESLLFKPLVLHNKPCQTSLPADQWPPVWPKLICVPPLEGSYFTPSSFDFEHAQELLSRINFLCRNPVLDEVRYLVKAQRQMEARGLVRQFEGQHGVKVDESFFVALDPWFKALYLRGLYEQFIELVPPPVPPSLLPPILPDFHT